MTHVTIDRKNKHAKQTTGVLNVVRNGVIVWQCHTLELPWLGNHRQISCIPTGSYNVKRRHSSKYGQHFHLVNVPNRDLILIHAGNFYHQTLGCILVGMDVKDIDKDGILDVSDSALAMRKLLELLPQEFTLDIWD
jgi:hypothetical protein